MRSSSTNSRPAAASKGQSCAAAVARSRALAVSCGGENSCRQPFSARRGQAVSSRSWLGNQSNSRSSRRIRLSDTSSCWPSAVSSSASCASRSPSAVSSRVTSSARVCSRARRFAWVSASACGEIFVLCCSDCARASGGRGCVIVRPDRSAVVVPGRARDGACQVLADAVRGLDPASFVQQDQADGSSCDWSAGPGCCAVRRWRFGSSQGLCKALRSGAVPSGWPAVLAQREVGGSFTGQQPRLGGGGPGLVLQPGVECVQFGIGTACQGRLTRSALRWLRLVWRCGCVGAAQYAAVQRQPAAFDAQRLGLGQVQALPACRQRIDPPAGRGRVGGTAALAGQFGIAPGRVQLLRQCPSADRFRPDRRRWWRFGLRWRPFPSSVPSAARPVLGFGIRSKLARH